MTTISSPCIQVCKIDSDTQLCDGCGRTVDEIRDWRRLEEHERLEIMGGLDERMRKATALALSATE
jgi:predicted Fe-S protein YdhL (DUF1289 family)